MARKKYLLTWGQGIFQRVILNCKNKPNSLEKSVFCNNIQTFSLWNPNMWTFGLRLNRNSLVIYNRYIHLQKTAVAVGKYGQQTNDKRPTKHQSPSLLLDFLFHTPMWCVLVSICMVSFSTYTIGHIENFSFNFKLPFM